MKTQVDSDKSVKVSAGLIRFVGTEADRVLDRFAARVTRVAIHLTDVNSRKSGAPKKAASKTLGASATSAPPRGPRKKSIFQARRKPWPTR